MNYLLAKFYFYLSTILTLDKHKCSLKLPKKSYLHLLYSVLYINKYTFVGNKLTYTSHHVKNKQIQ